MRANRAMPLAAVVVLLSMALFALGCGGAEHAEHSTAAGAAEGPAAASGLSEAQAEKVTRAATITREIEADPDRAAEILDAHGLTEDSFEELMYEIAGDQRMSAEFKAATR